MMGRIAALGALPLKGLSGWMGVPNAGDDDGIADEDGGACRRRKIGAGVLSISNRFLQSYTMQVEDQESCQEI